MSSVSIKDIAARTNVSFQTVSKVLRGKGSVSSETRAWILQVAEEMGYVPNTLARSLVSQRTGTIGVVSSISSDYVLAQLVVGAEQEARHQGQCVIIGNIDEEGSDSERYLRLLLERRVDGILLAAPQFEHNFHVGGMLREKVPVVSMFHIPGFDLAKVGSDHQETGYIATQHLLELGHRSIGTIIGSKERRVVQSRLQGYQKALAEAGVLYRADLVEEANWDAKSGYQAAQRLLERVPTLTAIFAHNDAMAIGALSALHDLELRVPEDCAVVGCDDIPIASHTIPPLTTVHLPLYETGAVAVRLLLDMIEHKETEQQRVLLPVYLVKRASSGSHVVRPL